MENKPVENPYNLKLESVCVIGVFDVLSLRKTSAIKKAFAQHAINGEVHLGIVADTLSFRLQETYPLQHEEQRAKNIYSEIDIKPIILMDEEALQRFIGEKRAYCRMILLSSESREMKDALKKLFENNNAVFDVVDAYAEDNTKFENYKEHSKKREHTYGRSGSTINTP